MTRPPEEEKRTEGPALQPWSPAGLLLQGTSLPKVQEPKALILLDKSRV